LKGKKIDILRSDNGGEYTSKEIISCCKYVWIKRELIVPYNPQKMELFKERIEPLKNLLSQ